MQTGLNYSYNASKDKNYTISQYSNTAANVPIYDEINGTMHNFLKDYTAFLKLDYSPNAHHFIRMGIESTVHYYQAHTSSDKERSYAQDSTLFSQITELSNPILKGYENAAFIDDEISFSSNVGLNLGLRCSAFSTAQETYTNLEPRLAFRWTIPHFVTINMTATQSVQYSHALLSNEIGLDRLIWVPSGNNLLPQKAQQISIGIAKQFKNSGIDISVEAYYKKMSNLSQFIFFSDFGDNIYQNWQNNILKNGKGETYGAEFLINKTQGRWNGMLSYTLSWNNRQFPDFNEGKIFPFKYDRRHILNTYLTYQFSPKWKMGALWTYNTGFRLTAPNGQVVDVPFFEGKKLLYTDINNAQMPHYHRLDLNVMKERKLKNGHIRTWSFNIYNAYARLNPTFIFVKEEYTNPITKQTTPAKIKGVVLLPFMPSVNYALKF